MIDRPEADYTFLIYGDWLCQCAERNRVSQADILGLAIASYPAQANLD